MKILVCVGSSCHLKGSYKVIEKFKELIKNYEVEDKVDLQASFCLGHCAEGVTVKVNDMFIKNISPDNVEEKFIEEIYPLIEKQ
jgi:NADH:ubiquinone oxidoreductase subunit E